MRTEVCPVKGFEQVKITFPSEWLIKHNEAFWAAYREAGDTVSHNTGLLYGCIAVCEKIEGLPALSPPSVPPSGGEVRVGPGEWPLQVYNWLLKTVYFDSLEKALNPPLKNS
jgi:hypothetical protein